MDKKKEAKTEDTTVKLRFPQTLTLRDLITIVSTVITLTLAWSTFSARLSLIEREVLDVKETVQAQQADLGRIKAAERKLEVRVQDNEAFIDQLYDSLKKPQPRRHTGD